MAITVTAPKKWAVALVARADVNEIPETVDTESGLASMTARRRTYRTAPTGR